MRSTALSVCLLATNIFAQDFFPLHVGNQWIYRTAIENRWFSNSTLTTIDIPRTETIGDQTYSVVRGFEDGPALLRMAEDRTLYRYNTESKSEEVWAAFNTKEGDAYQTAINTCNKTARVESRSAKSTVPAGDFVNAFAIRYPAANCADAGLDNEVYAPYVGLVERTSVTIAGPRRMQLVYARVGGVTVLSAPELSFTLALDKTVYAAGDPALVRMALRNTTPNPLTLTFNSGQRFDLVIRNQSGTEVYRWSAVRTFISLVSDEIIAAGERNYAETIPLTNNSGRPLAPGRYSIDAWIANSLAPQYAATVAFDIR